MMLMGCSEAEQTEQSDELTKVSLSFSPYEQSAMARTTRAASSIAGIVTHLDVWITDGTTTQDIHQTSSDTDFGSLSVTLNKTKTYIIYAIGHKADGATLSDGIISYERQGDAFDVLHHHLHAQRDHQPVMPDAAHRLAVLVLYHRPGARQCDEDDAHGQ